MSDNNGSTPKYDGVPVVLNGKTYIVPALTVSQARKLWPNILEMDSGITKENLPEKQGKMIEVIHTAFKRNYPDITAEEIEDMIELGVAGKASINRIISIVMGNSGLESVPPAQPVAEKALTVQ